jgi:enoyl-CoA hydratase/carnithine racemase
MNLGDKAVLKYEKRGRIAIITLNRPEVLNALNSEMFHKMHDALVDYRDDPNLRVAIVTGAGDKAFSAGVDIQETLPYISDSHIKEDLLAGTIMRGLEIWKPLIAAVNGIAYGCGCELALACDLIIASENASFAQPEIKVGTMPGAGGTQRLPRYIPRCKAAEMLLMGRILDAREAWRIGLVNGIVSLDELMPKAIEYGNIISQMAPLAVMASKEAMIKGFDMTIDDGLELEKALFNGLASSEDFSEGIIAFREKRKPNFKGK